VKVRGLGGHRHTVLARRPRGTARSGDPAGFEVGELYHRYERGLENQLGVLWLVLNCVVLWTTVYLDATVRQLRACRYAMRSGCSVATAEPSHKVKVDSDVSRWVLMR
jgi:hypothetical protein